MLTCAGPIDELAYEHIQLRKGLDLTFCLDDANEQGKRDEPRTEGAVPYDKSECSWVASVDWSANRHGSEEENEIVEDPRPPEPAPTTQNRPATLRNGSPSPSAKPSRSARGIISP
jgi:hypothetical protein